MLLFGLSKGLKIFQACYLSCRINNFGDHIFLRNLTDI